MFPPIVSIVARNCGAFRRFPSHLGRNEETVMKDAQKLPPQRQGQRQGMNDREAFWRMHCLSEPTFTDLTHGIFLGLVWSAVLWAPMFISVLF